MQQEYKDLINGFELTPTNFVRCLDEYLDTISIYDLKHLSNDTVVDLLYYLDYVSEIADIDLIKFAINRLTAMMLGF